MTHKRRANGFTLVELIIVMAIIGVLAAITAGSFMSAQFRSRDSRRKSDLNQIGKSLETYFNDKKLYPADNGSGQIIGCGTQAVETACSWGSPFQQRATGATTDTVYMVMLPSDPKAPNLVYYYDVAPNRKSYQIYARLENTEDKDVPKDGSGNGQVYSGLNCGNSSCNYGISSTNTTAAAGRSIVSE